MLLTGTDIENLLKENLDVKFVEAIDLKGGNHWQVNITATNFDGISRLKREQLVQKVLADLLANETIHALVVKAKGISEG